MNVGAVNFGNNVNVAKAPSAKQQGGGGKAVASALLPGLGQFIDGRNKDGAKYLGGIAGLSVLSTAVGTSIAHSFSKLATEATEKGVENLPKSGKGALIAKGVAALGIATVSTVMYVKNIIDAYRGGKEKTAEAPKEEKAAEVK